MKENTDNEKLTVGEKLLAGLIITLIVIALILLSWLGVCGIVKLITLCFGLKYTWRLPTGIYLIFVLIRFLFGKNNK